MRMVKDVRWRWIIIGAFTAEIVLVPVTLSGGWLLYSLEPPLWLNDLFFNASIFLVLFATSIWAAPKAGSRLILSGALIGLGAAIIFLPFLFMGVVGGALHETINEVLKIVGGATGGAVARHRLQRVPPRV